MQSDTMQKMPAYSAKHPFPNKNAPILCHCEERSDVAILKPKVWHPGTKHGNRKRQKSQRPSRISIRPAERHRHGASSEASFCAGESPHCTCFSIFHRPPIVFHCAAIQTVAVYHCTGFAVPRSGMPFRSVQDCRVGH